MSNNKRSNAPSLLSPILASILAAGAANAQDVSTEAPLANTLSSSLVTTHITHDAIQGKFDAQQAEKMLEGAKADAIAVQCGHYSVDSGGQAHCLFYDSANEPMSSPMSMRKFTV